MAGRALHGSFLCPAPGAQLGDLAPLLYYCANGTLQVVPFFVPEL
jgi:hypothetical protein